MQFVWELEGTAMGEAGTGYFQLKKTHKNSIYLTCLLIGYVKF